MTDLTYRYFNDLSQVFGYTEYRIIGGKADGMRAVDVRVNEGVHFTVFVDRCMDIGNMSYKGTNCNYISKAGYTGPHYYERTDDGWFHAFGGGLMSTCGLENVGSPSTFQNKRYGQHGTIGSTPAEGFSAQLTKTEYGAPCIELAGRMKTGWLFGPDILLTRKISVVYGENKIRIQDTIENRGYTDHHIALLYHFNIGYPLLTPTSLFLTNAHYWRCRDDFPSLSNNNTYMLGEPGMIEEHCFYYKQSSTNYTSVINTSIQKGIAIKTNGDELPYLANWRSPCLGDYCMGIEPANCVVEGVANQAEIGDLEYLAPGKQKNIHVEIELLDESNIPDIIRNHQMMYGAADTPDIYTDLY